MVRWKELAKAADTIVILMGMSQLEQILYKLIDAELRKDTKIAVIENATTKEQRIVKGNLNNIMNRVIKAKLKSPAVIIIGKVVSLQKKLDWFNK
jgi:uroporphyrin-III C-methyltransferase